MTTRMVIAEAGEFDNGRRTFVVEVNDYDDTGEMVTQRSRTPFEFGPDMSLDECKKAMREALASYFDPPAPPEPTPVASLIGQEL